MLLSLPAAGNSRFRFSCHSAGPTLDNRIFRRRSFFGAHQEVDLGRAI